MPRIAYFNASLRIGQDGVTRVLYRMFEEASRRGADVMAFGSALPPSQNTVVPMVQVPSVIFPLHASYRLAVPGYHSFKKELQRFQPDIIHINSPCTLGFAAAKYGRDYGVPVVATYHTHFPTYLRYYNLQGFEELTWRIIRRFYNSIERTFVPTVPILQELEARHIRNLQYLPNGIDLSMFHPKYRSQQWRERFTTENRPIVLFVSRLVWEKDLRVLAEAYQILRSRHVDFELVVVGDGHARQEFQKMVPGAHFLGHLTGRALAESYASSDIFVFPSTTETFGLVTLEAMASGLAPVAANVGGATGIITDGVSGLLAQPQHAHDLAMKLEWLIDNDTERWFIAENALCRAREFDWNKIMGQLFASYDDVIANYQYMQFRQAS